MTRRAGQRAAMRVTTIAEERPQDELTPSMSFDAFSVALESITGRARLRVRLRSLVARAFGQQVIVTIVGDIPDGQTLTIRISRRWAERIHEQLGKALGKA